MISGIKVTRRPVASAVRIASLIATASLTVLFSGAAGAVAAPLGAVSALEPAAVAGCPQQSALVIELDSGDVSAAQGVVDALGDNLGPCSPSLSVGAPDGSDVSITALTSQTLVSAAADGSVNGSAIFAKITPGYTFVDSNGTYDAQATYASSSLPVAMSFRLSSALQSIATGTVTANQARTPANCTYHKTGVSAAYLFHWSCPSHVKNTQYAMVGTFVFRVNVGGATGTATVTTTFRYRLT